MLWVVCLCLSIIRSGSFRHTSGSWQAEYWRVVKIPWAHRNRQTRNNNKKFPQRFVLLFFINSSCVSAADQGSCSWCPFLRSSKSWFLYCSEHNYCHSTTDSESFRSDYEWNRTTSTNRHQWQLCAAIANFRVAPPMRVKSTFEYCKCSLFPKQHTATFFFLAFLSLGNKNKQHLGTTIHNGLSLPQGGFKKERHKLGVFWSKMYLHIPHLQGTRIAPRTRTVPVSHTRSHSYILNTIWSICFAVTSIRKVLRYSDQNIFKLNLSRNQINRLDGIAQLVFLRGTCSC